MAVETGRWNKPIPVPFNDRKCVTCSILEDEYHFVLECILFRDLRKQYLPEYYWKRPNMWKFQELMTCTNVDITRNLSMFIYFAFKAKSL